MPTGLSGDTHLDFHDEMGAIYSFRVPAEGARKNHGSARLLGHKSYFGPRKPETENSGTRLSLRLEEPEILSRISFRRPSLHLERLQKVKF